MSENSPNENPPIDDTSHTDDSETVDHPYLLLEFAAGEGDSLSIRTTVQGIDSLYDESGELNMAELSDFLVQIGRSLKPAEETPREEGKKTLRPVPPPARRKRR